MPGKGRGILHSLLYLLVGGGGSVDPSLSFWFFWKFLSPQMVTPREKKKKVQHTQLITPRF